MNSVLVVQRLHQHRAWVNENLLAAASSLSDEQLRRPFEIGQGSVWNSLLHMYAAEFVWLEALQGNATAVAPGDIAGRLPGNQLGEGRIESVDELRTKWTELQSKWHSYLAALPEVALDEPVCRVSSSGQKLETKRSDVLLHVCTHAHYTAAQIVNMLRHAGCNTLPQAMLIAMARQEAHATA